MSVTMEINGSETGVVRLFHLDLPPEAVDRFTTQAGTGEWPLQYGLGAKRLRPAFVELVAIRDLEGMALSSYLVEAHNVQGTDFKAARAQIDALKGHVLVLPSQAFDNTSQTLTIRTPLRWIGTFTEAGPRKSAARLTSRSARGVTGTGPAPVGKGVSLALKIVLAVLAAVILAVVALAVRP
ncbi:aspartate carbamoyltransferase catalytic subunit [Aestuariicoccus sp. MJ-SS9]|uniref:aspartate carbamoyltransferase catalytic subunit n=1 Tax=Aestuariicoccus sp. MJ-SS9 TaxID=3079855 RepID=UPI00290FF012|nr:aspartate carbamoyltransferase catalytic subunit [Aestuariicoccus sp. MJ-SS9]MDU8909707.1 aspartate carbamoyltransferase catalytic subunit [Aestuariicoccus sp. MJ-SS9]